MTPMPGKTVVVTGASNGIGKAIAELIAARGAQVVMVGRDPARGLQALEEIRRKTGNENLRLVTAELSNRKDVQALGAQLRSELPRLDVLVNNAGAWFSSRQLSADGIEMTWALNHLSYFRLTRELEPLLRQTAAQFGEARVVSQSSGAHHEGAMRWDDLQFERDWDTAGKGSVGAGWGVYSQSKLANVLFSNALARRLAGAGVSSHAVHPGVVVTGFSQNNGWLYRLAAPLRRLLNQKTPADGAEPAVHAATAPQLKGVSGKYFGPPNREETPSELARDIDAQDRLWRLSEQML